MMSVSNSDKQQPIGSCTKKYFLGLVLSILGGTTAHAATFTVTNLNDSGPGSLRQAVSDANALLTANTITFQSGLTGTITLSGEIGITARTTISGPGENMLTLNGNGQSRIFNVNSAGATIQGLTVTGGHMNCGSAGTGIYNRGFLTLNHIIVSSSSGDYYCGGGLSGGTIHNSGSLTATYLTVLNNSNPLGGGIYNSGLFNATYALISGNSSNTDGGGIYNTTTMNLSNSMVIGNQSVRSGGGIYNDGGTLTFRNSTLYGNLSQANGGGIYGGAITLINTTVTGNAAVSAGGGIYGNGNSTIVGNSIVSGNISLSGKEIQTNAGFTSQGSNLFGENGASGIAGATPSGTDIILAGTVGTVLADPADNGGPTLTCALIAGSPAIDAGDNTLLPADITTDQRGAGFPRIVGAKVDIGAMEFGVGGPYALNITLAGTGTGTVTSNAGDINCGATCSANFASGTNVTLTAKPAAGMSFISWTGNCTGNATTCSVKMDAIKNVTATFNPTTYILTVITGGGTTVTSDPAGIINCNATCAKSFVTGTRVTLTETPVSGALFSGWSGSGCSGIGTTCAITMNGNKSVTTTFKVPDFIITGITLDPAVPPVNGTFTANVTIKNQKTVSGDAGQLAVWADKLNAQICNASSDQSAAVGVLAAGASTTIAVTGLSAGGRGIKNLRAFVDSGCTTKESSETNNQLVRQYRVTDKPDFIITDISLITPNPAPNSTFKASVTIKNQGTMNGIVGFLDIWSDQPTEQTCGAVGDSYFDIGYLGAGSSKTYPVSLPAGIAGSKTLRAFVDSWCETLESNETNNQATENYTVD